MHVLKKAENRQESREKSYCFHKWCFIINSERTLPSSATAVGRSSSARREEERVGCHPSTEVRVPHRVELYGPLALSALVAARYPRIVVVFTNYIPRQGKAAVI